MGTPFTATGQLFSVLPGSTGPADLLYDGYPADTDTVTAIHRTDWEGRQLLYPTARTNVQPYSNTLAIGYNYGGVVGTSGQTDPSGGTGALNVAWSMSSSVFTLSETANPEPSGQVVTMQLFLNFAGVPNGSGFFNIYCGDLRTLYGNLTYFTLTGGVPTATNGTLQLTSNGFYLWTNTLTLSGATLYLGWVFYGESASGNITIYGPQILLGSIGGTYIETTTSAPVTVTDYVDNGNGTISLGVAATAQDVYDWDGTGEYYIPAFGYFRPAYKRRDPPLSGAARQTEVRVQAKSLLTDGQYVSGRDRAKLRTRR